MGHYSKAVEIARDYYNSPDADHFYATIWGGEDIHIGIYEDEADSIFVASHRTVEKIAALLQVGPKQRVLDIGSGYGGTARYFAKYKGCQVDCLNLSEVQSQRNRQLNEEQGLTQQIRIIEGSFEDIPVSGGEYDVVLSQDAILHSGDRLQVFKEVARVLKPKGEFIFTDPMQSEDCPEGVLAPVLARIHLDSMGSIGLYTQNAESVGLEKVQVLEMTEHLITHYTRVLAELEFQYDQLLQLCHRDYLDRMKVGLQHWIRSGQQGYLAWGILHFRKV